MQEKLYVQLLKLLLKKDNVFFLLLPMDLPGWKVIVYLEVWLLV